MKHTTSSIRIFLLVSAASVSLFITACKKDKETESEIITKVAIHLTDIGSSFDETFEATDADGDGIFNTIDTIKLPVNSSFICEIKVYDEATDISNEIRVENTAHLFTYLSNASTLQVSNLNTDEQGQPFGLESIWSTLTASTGTIQVALHHEPTDKTASDPGGEIDFQVLFPVKIQ